MTIYHKSIFSQGSGQTLRWLEFELFDAEEPNRKTVEGRWRQRESSPEGINMYPNFTTDDKKRLRWRWDGTQHGGLIEIGVDTPSEDFKQGKYTFYRVWFSFRGAKRLASGQFRVAGKDYPNGEGVGLYHLGGSSNTFQAGEGQWQVSRYDRT